ncbi:MAG: DUF4124 domain-containing protein [Azoarcus sp.]|jgi:hypothetical protein|nr:DUF4124 domain-containing protein [Azoarcus sp.]
MKFPRAVIFLFFLASSLASAPATAQVFKCVDGSGKVTYSNERSSAKGCTQLSNEQAVTTVSMRVSPPPAASPAASYAPLVDMDKARKQALEGELDKERAALENARKKLAQEEETGQGSDFSWRQVSEEQFKANVNGKCEKREDGSLWCRGRNYQKVLDRLQPYKDEVERRERKVEALTQQISGLR